MKAIVAKGIRRGEVSGGVGTGGCIYVCAVLQEQLDEAGAPLFRCFVKGESAHP